MSSGKSPLAEVAHHAGVLAASPLWNRGNNVESLRAEATQAIGVNCENVGLMDQWTVGLAGSMKVGAH